MMSLCTIRQISRDAAIRAARENRIPFTVEPQDLADWKTRFQAGVLKFPFPFLGSYVPQGWKRTDRPPLFVDSTGEGRENEPALTVNATIDALIPGKAYAVIETGQFQLYLAEYERDDSSAGNESEFVGMTTNEEAEFKEVMEQEQALSDERDRIQNIDFEVRFQNERAHFTPLSQRAIDYIPKHFLEAVFDECGNLVLDELMGEMVVCSMRREGLRVNVMRSRTKGDHEADGRGGIRP